MTSQTNSNIEQINYRFIVFLYRMLAARNFFPRLFGVHPIPFVSQLPLVGVAFVLQLLCMQTFAVQVLAQSGTPAAPERIVSPVRSDLPGRTVWAFATTGTGTSVTTFAATDRGLFRSSGTTWTETTLRNQAVYAVKSRRIGNTVTLLAGTDRGVQRSVDNGATWQSVEVTTGSVGTTSNVLSVRKVFDIEIIQPGNGNGNGNSVIWFAATEKGVFRSNNDGRSWTLVNIDRTVDNNEVRGITTDGNTIIVNLWREGLWRSTNNGNSWSRLTIAGETALCRAVFAFSSTNATVWLAGSIAGNIWRSTNSGTSWTRVYQGTSIARTTSSAMNGAMTMGVDAIAGDVLIGYRGRKLYTLFATTPGGVLFSLNGGLVWERTRTPDSQAQSIVVAGNKVYVGQDAPSSTFVAGKEVGATLSSASGGFEYDATCGGSEFNQTRAQCGGGGGTGGTSGGTTGNTGGQYTIISKAPRIRSLNPSSFSPATSQAMAIAGDNFALSLDPDPGTDIPDAFVMADSNASASQQYFLPRISYSNFTYNTTIGAQQANTPGTYFVRVVTFFGETYSAPFTVVAPSPTLTNITPATAIAGQTITLTANGSNFGTAGELRLNGAPIQGINYTTRTSSQIIATFPAPVVSATPYNITILANGQTTTPQTLTVSNPQASVSGVSTNPTPVVAGQTFTVTVSGSNFLAGVAPNASVVTVSGPSGTMNVSPTISASQITFSFTPPQSGTYTVNVQNPGTPSATGQFTVQAAPPQPQATSLTQNGQAVVSTFFNPIASDQTLTLNGANFQQTTIVRVTRDNTTIERTPSAWTANSLTFTLPGSMLSQPQKHLTISAFTPPFPGTSIGGGLSAQAVSYYVVMPAPTLAPLATTSVNAGLSSLPLPLSGSGIALGHTILEWTMNGETSQIPIEGSDPNWSAGIGNLLIQYPAGATLRLRNPAFQGVGAQAGQSFGGGVSLEQTFTVNNIQPRLDSLQPRVYGWFGVETGIQLIIDGNNFVPRTTKLLLNGVEQSITPQGASSTRITHTVNFASVGFTPPGILTVRVKNPAQGVISANNTDLLSARTDTFRIVNPAPRIFNAAPEFSITTLPQQITLSGEAFLTGVSASIGGVNAPVQRNSANQIIVSFDAAVLARLQSLGAGVHHLIVRNPAPALAEASLPITLTNPAIITLTVQPNPHTLTAPPSAQTVTLTALQSSGTPYIATNATVSFRGQTFPIASRPAQDRVTALIPASLLGEAGNVPITVNQPAVQNASGQSVGASSQQAAWVLNNPRPVVNAMTTNPNPAQTGADATLTIDGSAFVPLAKIVVRGVEYTPSSNTGTRLTVTIPASALDSAGAFPVVVRNPQGGGDAVNQPTLTVLAPQPRLLVLAPPSSVRSLTNQQPIQLGLGGSGFVRGSRVIWGVGVSNTPLVASYSNANQLSVSVPANLLTQAGTFRLVVVNDALAGQGGGTSDTLSFILQNPTASLVSVNPTLLPRFAASAALTLTGDNFVQGARVLVTGLNNVVDTLTAQVLSPTEAQITLPASLLDSAVTLQIRVLNPAPVQSASGVAQASVVNPRPRLTSMNPTQTLTGLPSLTVNVQGTSFMDGVTGFANGLPVPTNRQNDNNAVLTLPASVLAQAGTVVITLQNPTPRVQPEFSDSLSLIVNNPLPRLDSAVAIGTLGMSTLVVSTQATTVTLFGDNFILASQVKENGASTSSGSRMESMLSSSRLSLNQITTVVPAAMTAEAGTVRLTVENPTPGGGRSQSVVMNVLHPVPVAERITPSVVVIPTSDLAITITGDRFVNTAEILVNGTPVTVQSRTATRITASIPAAMLASRGFYTVTVRNPATNGNDGGTSEALTLRVNTPQPLLSALSPAQIPLDTLDVPLTITGSRFLPEAIVRITTPDGVNATVATTGITATEIRATLPASLVNRGGIYSLRVENPAPSDPVSAPLTFALVNPVPQMDSLALRVITGGTNPQTITVFGQKFTPTSVVRWRGQDLATTFVSRTSLTAIIPPAQQVRGAVGAVTVFTPTDGVVVGGMPVGGGTGSAPGLAGVLTLTHGTPSLTSSTPAALLRDAWSANALPSLTLNGQLFASTATVRVRSSAGMNAVDTVLTPTSVSASGLALVVTMPRAVMTTAGTFSLTVTNPRAFPAQLLSDDGGISSALNVTVQNPTPSLSSLAPASLAAASPNTALTVNGANFTRETQLFINGMPAERTIVSASQLTTALPASLFTLSGFVRVQVLNPAPSQTGSVNGDSSNTLSLEVFNPVPTFTSVNPVFAPIGGRAPADSVTLTLVGTNFVRNSVARIATTVAGAPTTDLPTTFVATTTLTVRLLAADWRAQAYNLTVLNPTPRGGTSVARRFTVTNPLPVLTALLPNSTTASGRAWTLRVIGNFFTSTSQISYNKALQSLANTTYIPNSSTPSTQDTLLVKLAAVPVGDTTFPVVVVNPPTGGVGGGASDTLRLAIGLPAPTITSLSPATTTATLGDRNRAWTLTVNGTLFDDAAKVWVNGREVYTEFVSTTRLRAVFPDSFQAAQARRSVQVRNTALLVSNLVPHIVQNPAPVLTTIDPATVIAGRDTVLTLTGDRFAPDASVRLTFGTTATTLVPQSRDSVIGLTVRIPAALTHVRGAYSLRVSNPALAPTMVPPDTLALGGGLSVSQTLTVNADVPHSVEYIGLDTLLNTGDRLWFFTLRFRDKTGNLVDNDPVTLTYTNLDSTVVTGYFPITRTSLGTYRADTLRFPVAGRYLVQADTGLTGRLVVLGQDRFTVLTRSASRVEIEGVTSTFTAGDSLPRLTFRYFDSQNNLTDLGSRIVIVTATVGGTAYRDTLLLNRTQTGVYTVPAQRYTGAAFYTITPLGITATNITGERTFTVTPRPASQVAFSGVTPALASGGVQTRFRATLRDTFQNLTDVAQWDSVTIVQPTHVAFTMSTDATLDDSTKSVNAGFFTIQRTSLGVFTADLAAPFLQSGNYALSMQGIASTSGTAAFVVRPNVDFRVVFENVPDTLTAGDSLKNVVVRYFDRNDNPTDNSLGRITYARAGGSSTATVSTTRLETGVYALNSTQATIAGTYTLSVAGITSLNMEGNRRVVFLPAPSVAATFTLSTSSMTARGATVNMTLRFHDRFGNPAAFDGEVIADNQQLVSTATVSIIPQTTVGLYTARLTVLEPGLYALTAKRGTTQMNIRGVSDFSINPGRAVRATFDNVPTSVLVGSPMYGVAVQFFDGLGAPTNHWYGDAIISGPETKPVIFNMRDEFGLAHSGWFDLDSATVINSVGRHTFVVYDSARVELRMSAARSVNVVALPQRAEISFGSLNPNGTANAAAALPITVRFRDTLGNVADVSTPVRLIASTSAFIPTLENASLVRVLTRSVVAGVPQFSTTVTPSTAGTYVFAIEPLPVINRAPGIVGTNPLVVIPALPRTVELALSAPSVPMNTGELCVTLTFRDAVGNLADIQPGGVGSTLSFQYASGTISSTGNVQISAAERQSLGVYQVCGLRFAQANINAAHSYALVVQGITVANTRGQRTFQVLNPLPALFSITPSVIIENCGSTFAFLPIDRGNAALTSADNSAASSTTSPVPGVQPRTITTEEKPQMLKLYTNAPNPFRDATTIWYDLAEHATVQLTVKDVNGRTVAEVVNLHQDAGSYETQWTPPAALPSGTYLIQLLVKTDSGKQMQQTVKAQRSK